MYKKFKDFISRKFNPKGYYAARGKIYPKNIEELDALVNDPKTNLADIIIPKRITNFGQLFLKTKRTDFSGLETWDVSHVTDMNHMFYRCKTFTGKEIENWDVSSVRDFWGIFSECDNFDADLSKWKFGVFNSCSEMFSFCEKFTGKGLENWDTSRVKNMDQMFYRCKNFTGKPIENWNVKNVENMEQMFHQCENFDADLSRWDLSSLKKARSIFHLTKNENIPNNFLKKFEDFSYSEKEHETPQGYFLR